MGFYLVVAGLPGAGADLVAPLGLDDELRDVHRSADRVGAAGSRRCLADASRRSDPETARDVFTGGLIGTASCWWC